MKSKIKKIVATLVVTTLVGVSGYLGIDYATLPTDNKVTVSSISLGLRGENIQTKVLRVVDGDTFEIMY
jgi:endonuclease YncB( thermonuclease family)